MLRNVDWTRSPEGPRSVLTVLLALSGLVYFGVVTLTSVLAPYRFAIPYAVPIFDTPFVLAAIGVGYLCWERHRVRQDVRSASLGGALWLAGLLGVAHILAQPDYSSTLGVNPGIAPYFFFLSYLAGFVGVALAASLADRQLPLSDRARLRIAAAALGLSVVIVVAVWAIRPLLPSLVMKPGRLTPFAILAGALSAGLAGVWALAAGRKRASGKDGDVLAAYLPLAAFIWLLGLTGFLLWPFRYGLPWYIAGLARPVGLGVILVGVMREQIWLYREIISKNRDLTARELMARAEAAASERRFVGLVQDLDAVVWEADATWRFSFVSDRAEAILGYPVALWLAEPQLFERHIHSDDREQTLALFREAAAQGRNSSFEYRAVAADARTVWLRAIVHVVQDAHGRVEKLRGLMVDVSERRQLEDELRQAQKMEAVGRLAGGIAHDFNNLLTVIMGQTQLLRLRGERPTPPDGEVALIEKAAERAAELTRQLVAFSRKQVLQPKVIDLNAVVNHMGAMLRRVIGERIELVMSLKPRLWRVKADPGQVEQVIMNLALNARDAMPAGGRLTMTTTNVTVEATSQRQRALAPPGAYVALTVSDTGCGMDAQTQSRVFEPFFTTKEIGRGAGLGLSTVYGIVNQSGGAIRVDSEPGGGSTFTIYLARVDDPIPPLEPRRPAIEALRGSETILVVEDEDEVRDVVLQALGINGYSVLQARDGREALAIADRQPGPIHLLVTDVVMPHMNGRELAEQLSPRRPEMKVLYMSGYTNDFVRSPSAGDQQTAFLQKPFSCETLGQKVRGVLDAGAPAALVHVHE